MEAAPGDRGGKVALTRIEVQAPEAPQSGLAEAVDGRWLPSAIGPGSALNQAQHLQLPQAFARGLQADALKEGGLPGREDAVLAQMAQKVELLWGQSVFHVLFPFMV